MRSRLISPSAVAALVAVVLVAPAASAHGEGYPPRTVRVVSGTVDNDILARGRSVVLRGEGFAPGAEVRLSLDGEPAGTATADGTGGAEGRFVVNEEGERVLALSGLEADGDLRVVSAPVLVVRSLSLPAGVAGESVDADSTAPGLASGFALVALGAGALFALRVRPRRAVRGR